MPDTLSAALDFVLPASFQPADFLAGQLAVRADDARWLISTIVRKTANRDTDIWGCVRLSSKILRRVMDSHSSAQVILALKRGGAIELAPYCVGAMPMGFRLAGRYLGDRCIRIPAVDPRLIDRISRERERLKTLEQRERWQQVHYDLCEGQRHITIMADADKLVDSLPEHTRLCQDVLVSNIRSKNYQFCVGSTGRVFNAITGLKRELRTTLRIDGQPVGSVDIACAQPALLAFLLDPNTPTIGPKHRPTYKLLPRCSPLLSPSAFLPSALPVVGPDFAVFRTSVSSGTFYDLLSDRSGLPRPIVKLRFLVDVLAKRGRYRSAVESLFREMFPSVYRAVRLINASDHGNLIRLLQRAESWLVVEQIAPRLLANQIAIATLHDAIFSADQSVDDVHSAFVEVLS
ncbi:MAG: hypothetical protein HY000_02145, partial [Planctomycetes bacterium]|nr:hypothetical protein [Planctomycetota bacterium]